MPRWHRVADLARKEIRDIVRDRRTVFMAIIFPIILYPLLIIALIQATIVQKTKAEKEKPLVAIAGARFAPALAERLSGDDGLTTTAFDGTVAQFKKVAADAGIVIPENAGATLASGGTAEVKIIYDSADEKSLDAKARVVSVVAVYSRDVLGRRLQAASLDAAYVDPVKIDERDIATPRQRGVFRLGKMLAFLLVVFCMMGALYPALDTIAGEKERGTLETLLSIPATRLEILAGKYVAVLSMSVASVVANFMSLSLTMLLVNRLLADASPKNLPIDFSIPISAVFYLVPALLPLAAFFSAVSLGIAAFANSTREGQYYLGPLYAAALPLTAAAVIPGMNLTYLTALVPIMSISLFLKDGLLGTLSPGPTALAISAQCLYAAVALKWASWVFSREDVLFASPAAEGGALPSARGYARPAHILVAWAVSVILFFYAGALLQERLGAVSVVTAHVCYVGFIILPMLVLVLVDGLDAGRILPFAPLGGRRLKATLVLVVAAPLVSVAAGALQHALLPAPTAVAKILGQQKASLAALFISVAFLPAVCEELFYRGLALRSLSVRMSARWAVVLSSLFFAAAHLNVYEFVPLFALGVVLALAMRATGTLLAPMLVHFANNSFTLFVALEKVHVSVDYFSAFVAGVLGVGLVALALMLAGKSRAK